MSTISEMIERASPHTDYVTTSTADELYDAWRASGRDAHYHIVVNTCDDHDALMFRLVPLPHGIEPRRKIYPSNGVISIEVVIAMLGVTCMMLYGIYYVVREFFFS